MLDIFFITPYKIIFEGQAKSVILPGEKGVFEILAFHKNVFSRLLAGVVIIDKKVFEIKRGIVKVDRNKVALVAEVGK